MAILLCTAEITLAYVLVGMNAVIPFTGETTVVAFNGLHPFALLATAITVIPGVVGALGLLLLRRWPVAATIVVMTGAALSGTIVPATILAYVVISRASVQRSIATATVYVAALVVGSFTPLGDAASQLVFGAEATIPGTLALRAAWATLCALAALLSRFVWQVDALEASREKEERRLLIESAVIGERNRIAREMHDVIGHKISLIALHAGSLRLHAENEQTFASATVIRDASTDALKELRHVLNILRGDSEDEDQMTPQPTLSDIDALVSSSAAAGVAVDYRNTVRTPLEPTLSRTVYRIVQEALTNVHRHAPGRAATIELAQSDSQLIVRAQNALPQAQSAPRRRGGQGLVGVAERARSFGGTVTYGPAPNGVWLLTVSFPNV